MKDEDWGKIYNDKDWDIVYDAGIKTGSSKERVRILNIIEEFVAEAGERAIQLRKNAAMFRDGTGNERELNGLAEVAEYEQGAYVKVMKKINEKES